mmetsp:Transcript_99309/g.212771  ORF Transcript_99309/g.212771 Transcript_99309/m.212771 type:complete len:102 (-) Transcript_99309:251-556(-)
MSLVNAVTALHRVAKSSDGDEAVGGVVFAALSAIVREEASRGDAIDPRSLANTAWSFASLAFTDEPLLPSIAAAALPKISDFYSQSISNMSWSVARLCLMD